MIRLELIESRCDDCGRCDTHYPGIRELTRLEGGIWRFNATEWRLIGEAVRAAAKACRPDALFWIDERGEWG